MCSIGLSVFQLILWGKFENLNHKDLYTWDGCVGCSSCANTWRAWCCFGWPTKSTYHWHDFVRLPAVLQTLLQRWCFARWSVGGRALVLIWIYVCMYVRMYVCTYVCMYVCMYVCTYVYVCMYVRTYVCMYVCMYVYVYVYVYVNVYV